MVYCILMGSWHRHRSFRASFLKPATALGPEQHLCAMPRGPCFRPLNRVLPFSFGSTLDGSQSSFGALLNSVQLSSPGRARNYPKTVSRAPTLRGSVTIQAFFRRNSRFRWPLPECLTVPTFG